MAATRFRPHGTSEEWETWLTAPTAKALKLHRPLENGLLKIVLTGEQKDAVS
jgi:hypothetical protein